MVCIRTWQEALIIESEDHERLSFDGLLNINVVLCVTTNGIKIYIRKKKDLPVCEYLASLNEGVVVLRWTRKGWRLLQ